MLNFMMYQVVDEIKVGQKLFWTAWSTSSEPITVLRLNKKNSNLVFIGTSYLDPTKEHIYYVHHDTYHWLLIEDVVDNTAQQLQEDLID